ncbi:MAG: RodZ domain-containing protein [Gaiellaceae bacterium]
MFEIGNSLREARYRQQLELTDVEQATKIRSRYLRALEEETFEVLPAQTYVKGFLRNYADYLGLDGQLYVDEYNSRYGVGDEEPREPVVARRSSAVHSRHSRLERRGVIFALAGIGALFALVIAAWKFSGNNNPPIPSNLGGPNPKTKPASKHRSTPRSAPFRFFTVAVNGPCWMDVHAYSANGIGRALFTGTVDPGQQHWWSRRTPLWIHIGNPANLKASINGQAVTIPGGGRSVRIVVSATGIRLASATGTA